MIRSELNLAGDESFNYPMWKWAVMQREGWADGMLYLFGRGRDNRPDIQRDPREAIGALHGDEVPYVFGTLNRVRHWTEPSGKTAGSKPIETSSAIVRWANFVKRGDPNGPASAMAAIPGRRRRSVMHFENAPTVGPDERTARMTLLDTVFRSPAHEGG